MGSGSVCIGCCQLPCSLQVVWWKWECDFPRPCSPGTPGSPCHLPRTPTVKRTGHWCTRAHTPSHTHTHNLPACLSISSPSMAPPLPYKGHISPVITGKSQRISHLTVCTIIRSNLELPSLEILQEANHKETTSWIIAYAANESCNCKSDSTPQPHAVMSTRHCLNDSNEIDADSPSMNDSSYEDVCWEWDMMGECVCECAHILVVLVCMCGCWRPLNGVFNSGINNLHDLWARLVSLSH